jgi:hypothetical protein
MNTCLNCSQPFDPTKLVRKGNSNTARIKYCSKSCRRAYRLKVYGRQGSFNLPTGTIGAMAELAAAQDLLKRGYEVYRALSPSCSGDLLAEKQGKTFKLEVRTAYRHSISKKIFCSFKSVRSQVVALVLFDENSVEYVTYPDREPAHL